MIAVAKNNVFSRKSMWKESYPKRAVKKWVVAATNVLIMVFYVIIEGKWHRNVAWWAPIWLLGDKTQLSVTWPRKALNDSTSTFQNIFVGSSKDHKLLHISICWLPCSHFWPSQQPMSAKPVPVIGFGLLQLLVLPGMPLFKLHLGLLLPLRFLLARILICRDRSRGRCAQELDRETPEEDPVRKIRNPDVFCIT